MKELAVLSLPLARWWRGLTEAEYHYNKGVDYQREGRSDEAIAKYDKAIELDPDLAKAHYNRGNAYGKLGDFKRAIKDFDEAIRIDPQNVVAYDNRALAYTGLGKDQEAERDIERAVELGLDDADRLREEVETLKAQH